MDFTIKNKVGIITGGTGRIGKYLAKELAKLNKVYSLDLMIQENSSRVVNIQTDLKDINSVKNSIDHISNKEGQIDFLINCAALQITKPFESISIEEFETSIDVNLTGLYRVIKQVSKVFIDQKFGNIINFSSIYGVVISDPNMYGDSGLNSPDVYAASKAGLIQLSKYLAVNLAKYNIRVNSISPAGVFNNQDTEFLDKYLPKVPLGRMMDKEELLGPVLFLLSPNSSYITGHNLMVDGGFTLL
tara:strand:- start:420 stop:1154 length:735 start_codon:yes stop_codon:yes gene_type:complete